LSSAFVSDVAPRVKAEIVLVCVTVRSDTIVVSITATETVVNWQIHTVMDERESIILLACADRFCWNNSAIGAVSAVGAINSVSSFSSVSTVRDNGEGVFISAVGVAVELAWDDGGWVNIFSNASFINVAPLGFTVGSLVSCTVWIETSIMGIASTKSIVDWILNNSISNVGKAVVWKAFTE
jgi:hypothetical protein